MATTHGRYFFTASTLPEVKGGFMNDEGMMQTGNHSTKGNDAPVTLRFSSRCTTSRWYLQAFTLK
ncbi:MAG: hypothetical protein KGM99_18965, partial [Burkholderiales bacterium]|nr:hypothetical protein [Burkholderiales bacterium]